MDLDTRSHMFNMILCTMTKDIGARRIITLKNNLNKCSNIKISDIAKFAS